MNSSTQHRPIGPTGTAGMAQLHQAVPLVERLHVLVEHLATHTGRPTPGPVLAKRLGVSTRTVERDIGRLVAAGLPVAATHGPNGGYRLDAVQRMPQITFTVAETAALIAALAAIGPYRSAAAASATNKLLAAIHC